MKDTIIGLDLAKNNFHLVIINRSGTEQRKRKFRRSQVLPFFSNLELTTVAMEACASAHYWAREFKKLGHEVKLLPPQHVKGYLRGQKNDYNDALAIAEAELHGRIRPVKAKSIEQQDQQALLRIRKQLASEQTRLTNQMRGLLGEYGVVLAKGETVARREIPGILEDADNGLSFKSNLG